MSESIKKGILQDKALELLLVLSDINTDINAVITPALPESQVMLAKRAATYLAENMERHIAISELAKKLHVS